MGQREVIGASRIIMSQVFSSGMGMYSCVERCLPAAPSTFLCCRTQ